MEGLTKAHAAANRILYMKSKKPPINSSKGSDLREPCPSETVIEFQNVHFRYPTRPDVEVLRGLNLKVRKGKKICITGPSGCGKSTVLHLLERFYDVTSGEVLINGISISALEIKAFRSTLGLVAQDTILYQGTIHENIVLGMDREVDEKTIVAVCQDANIHDFIASLPEGYNTECGPRGLALSGGQRQRLAIARALLRNPDILLLDEATSALDPESQNLVLKALEKASKGRTIISVSHQTEVIKQADRVFVLEHGKAVESGSYDELISRRGRFWEIQGELITGS
jgi:ATP-binding cassette, subfamily B (MDR/TAP), member 1